MSCWEIKTNSVFECKIKANKKSKLIDEGLDRIISIRDYSLKNKVRGGNKASISNTCRLHTDKNCPLFFNLQVTYPLLIHIRTVEAAIRLRYSRLSLITEHNFHPIK